MVLEQRNLMNIHRTEQISQYYTRLKTEVRKDSSSTNIYTVILNPIMKNAYVMRIPDEPTDTTVVLFSAKAICEDLKIM